VFTLAGWVIASLGMRLYVENVADYNATYGSIGAVIVLMLWLYLNAGTLLVGAEINAVIAGLRAEPAPGGRRTMLTPTGAPDAGVGRGPLARTPKEFPLTRRP
jgi:membrane protein